MKKILALVACLSLVASLAIGGSIAYLTDRDSEANVFTIGDVSIDLTETFPSTKLVPGITLEKKPVITNTGTNNAYVWMEFAIPSALDQFIQGTETGSDKNIIHWNPKGATTEGYVNDERVNKAKEEGFFANVENVDELTAKYINDNKMHWNVFNSLGTGKNTYQKKINGVDYNVYVLLYNKALTPKETTLPNISTVFLDARIDIDPNGDWYRVENGVATKIEWNSKNNGGPVIYVSAYGIQADGFEAKEGKSAVQVAYEAYKGQWGENGYEYGIAGTPVSNTADATTALEQPEATVTLSASIEATESIMMKNGGTFNGAGNTITKTEYNGTGNNAVVETTGGTIENLKVVNNTAGAAKGLRAVYMTGGMKEDLIINNCVLDGTYAINVNQAGTTHKLIVSNSTLNGWTSYGTIGGAEFTNVKFGEGTTGYSHIQPQANTTFTDCEFSDGFTFAIGPDSGEKCALTITINNCTYGGEKLTAQNFKEKLAKDEAASFVNSKVIVDGVTVTNLK